MLVQLQSEATETDMARLLDAIAAGGGRAQVARERGVVGVGGGSATLATALGHLPGVAAVTTSTGKAPLASRAFSPDTSRIPVGDVVIGGDTPVIMAGPCTVESEDQLLATAHAVKAAGAHLLRGGAFKPRTSPYAFQGLGEAGLRILARARAEIGLPIITEVMEPGLVGLVAEVADILQIGSRNMQNYPLLRAAGRSGRPVMVKRGLAATVDEWLQAAEYVLAEGNAQVMLCERGVRGFDPAVRHTLDLAAVPLARSLSHLPVIVDPSHGTGRRALVRSMALAGLAAGADGLMIEVHLTPDEALCDGDQSILPAELADITARAGALRALIA
ncbi:MAG: 3-deoxy-7-phosphoheptulonate synthase [Chloroflexi bacterium]|nr:3-deoxy-7-phosphoheptulonate synthase [Chloroflexota bacterium]